MADADRANPRDSRRAEGLTKALLGSQVKSGAAEAGSWDPEADRWGWAGGRVYATAMNVRTLEIYYRPPPGDGRKP